MLSPLKQKWFLQVEKESFFELMGAKITDVKAFRKLKDLTKARDHVISGVLAEERPEYSFSISDQGPTLCQVWGQHSSLLVN